MQNKKYVKQPKKELTFTQIKIDRNNIIAESKDSVLIDYIEPFMEEPIRFWIQKKYVFPSQYTLNANISIVPEWEYKYKDKEDKEIITLGYDIIEVLGE